MQYAMSDIRKFVGGNFMSKKAEIAQIARLARKFIVKLNRDKSANANTKI